MFPGAGGNGFLLDGIRGPALEPGLDGDGDSGGVLLPIPELGGSRGKDLLPRLPWSVDESGVVGLEVFPEATK